jgi:Peptidase family S41/N-terminal domain of Peptidase_S41 in eukaryotic IRBP
MSTRLLLGAMIFSLCSIALAAASAPSIPDTPAGRALGAWLDAFNSGDRTRVESFIRTRASWMKLEGIMRWRAETDGYELLTIESSRDTDVVFRVRQKAGPQEEIGRIKVGAGDPPAVSELGLHPIPTGARFEPVSLDAAARARVIDRVTALLKNSYVFAETANKMSADLKKRERRGEYRAITDGEAFAARLTDDLRAVSHDRHLEVRFSLVVLPPGEPGPHPEAEADLRRELAAVNCGFEEAEHLPPNIGYLKFNMFADAAICGPTATAGLNFLADSDVLILDLRDDHGGRGGMEELIASYLFEEPTHLNDAYNRHDNATKEFWTLPYVPGRKFIGKPVFVLTSKGTFSAAEDFSYALKNLKRATLIGETTGGGAHPIEPHRIDDHFSLIVPVARSVSPITKTDWEGVGVEPDIKVPAADALDEALKRARKLTAGAQSAR